MGNAIRYAEGTIELILVRRDERIVLHVLDKGPGFQFSPRLPPDLYSEFGRGLFLISKLGTDFTVERRPGGGSHARIVLA
jgi:anti-sigma regulatory factor (Ser/Thr protein kinase)